MGCFRGDPCGAGVRKAPAGAEWALLVHIFVNRPAYLGEYVADFKPFDGAHLELLIDDGGLAIDIPGQQTFALLPPNESGRWHFAVTDLASVVFLKDDEGAVTGILLSDPRGTNELPRADD